MFSAQQMRHMERSRTGRNSAVHTVWPVLTRAPWMTQPEVPISSPGDAHEREADRVAGAISHGQAMTEPPSREEGRCGASHLASSSNSRAVPRSLDEPASTAALRTSAPTQPAGMLRDVVRSEGRPLDPPTKYFFEARFGRDFSRVRVHSDESANRMVGAFNARALTYGHHIAFGHALYQPDVPDGRRLLAHELAHVVQQGNSNRTPTTASAAPTGQRMAQTATPMVQRTISDGHDLTSPRFSRLVDLEAVYDDETILDLGRVGRSVQALQQALYDLGFPLPTHGADGSFGVETQSAVTAFQAAHPPLVPDGRVGAKTMAALDALFGALPLPLAAVLSAPWTPACVRSVLCGWSPHTVEVLRTRVTLKSFDTISWADEEWNGALWVAAPFPGGGYNTGSEIGVLNGSCQAIAQTLYHEVLHADQPTAQSTTLAKESYAYRIGEEMSIGLGLSGRPALRSTDVQGRQFADPGKVAGFVATKYPAVPSGAPGEEIIGKGVAPGSVRVQRPDGSIYARPAAVGEKVPGPIHLVNEFTHPKAAWTCP
jgi:hypothetical protein